jgi:hypothetical protein
METLPEYLPRVARGRPDPGDFALPAAEWVNQN